MHSQRSSKTDVWKWDAKKRPNWSNFTKKLKENYVYYKYFSVSDTRAIWNKYPGEKFSKILYASFLEYWQDTSFY